jgi:hypothetical protein
VDDEVDKGKSVVPIPAAGGDQDNSGEYEIETAKSSRSVCKSCNEKIEKGHVRTTSICTLLFRNIDLSGCNVIHIIHIQTN